MKPKYKIGAKYKTRGKVPRLCTVVDILFTYNNDNELVKIRYVSEHDFMGQKIKDFDVVETTITMGLV